MGQDNPAVLIFVKHRKQRGGKRPMSAIVKYTTINPVSMKSTDEKSYLNSVQRFLFCAVVKYENSGQSTLNVIIF